MKFRICHAVMAIGMLAFVPNVFGIETAGELFVNLDATSFLANGADQRVWTNPGSYTNFQADGNPVPILTDPVPSVYFDGNSAFFGLDSAPEGLTGFDPTRSIEVWAFNPTIADEETIVSWGQRGGGDGTNMAFNYGNNGRFGAVGHWGGDNPDMGWVDNGPDQDDPGNFTVGAPAAGQWHHLVYTYDEEIARVYSDGELQNFEDMQQFGGLDTHVDPAIAIASQWESDGVTLTPGLRGSMWISRVRIHDGVLSDEQITANYNEERSVFNFDPTLPPPTPLAPAEALTAGPIHRYDFNNSAAGDASDAVIEDIVGVANGVVLGAGSSFDGEKLSLNGGPSDTAAYVDLPNGLISGLTSVTIEGWVTIDGSQTWSRIFDFGSNSPGEEDGELEGPGDDNGGDTSGLDYFFLSAQRGDNISDQRVEIRNEDPAGGGVITIDSSEPTAAGDTYHFVVSFDGDEDGGTVTYYRNGRLESEGDTDIPLSEINDVNNWLGRSNWTNDANLEGSYDEFRIYDYALTEGQAVGSFLAGPNLLNLPSSGDIDGDGDCDADDIDALAAAIQSGQTDAVFDLNQDGVVSESDRLMLITELKGTWLGDANLDGEFSSGDFVSVFTAGLYDTGQPASWSTGDWNGDGVFDSGDFVAAFTEGGYELGPRDAAATVPEPATAVLLLLGILGAANRLRNQQ